MNKALATGNYKESISYCSEDIKRENVGANTFSGKTELFNYIKSAYDSITLTTDSHTTEHDFVAEFCHLVCVKTVSQTRVPFVTFEDLRTD